MMLRAPVLLVRGAIASQQTRSYSLVTPPDIVLKKSTTLVGLPVVPNYREVIEFLSNKLIDELRNMPDCYYKQEVETMAKTRLKVVQEETDWRRIEARLGTQQVEELINEMEDELQLIPHVYAKKIWEVPADRKVKVTIMDTPIFNEDFDVEHDAAQEPTEIRVSSHRTDEQLASVLSAEGLKHVVRVDSQFEDPEVTAAFVEAEAEERFW